MKREAWSVMECEKSVMVMILIWLDYLIHNLGNCIDDTPTETGLTRVSSGCLLYRFAWFFFFGCRARGTVR